MPLDLSKIVTAEEQADRDNAAAIESSIKAAAQRRWEREVAGVTWNGFMIDTERESQSKVNQADRAVQKGQRVDGAVWKCYDIEAGEIVFRPTTNDEMSDIANRVYDYVAACFDREAELLEAIRDGSYTEDMLDTGWPDQ